MGYVWSNTTSGGQTRTRRRVMASTPFVAIHMSNIPVIHFMLLPGCTVQFYKTELPTRVRNNSPHHISKCTTRQISNTTADSYLIPPTHLNAHGSRLTHGSRSTFNLPHCTGSKRTLLQVACAQ